MTRPPWRETPQEMARGAWKTPWKAGNELGRILMWPILRAYFAAHGVAWAAGWRVYGLPIIQRHRGSRISIGRDFWMRNTRRSNPLGVIHPCILATWSPEAVVEIGASVGISGGSICATERISIGDRVLIGANCTIVDSDFHPLGPSHRAADPTLGRSEPVVIEADAFLGAQTMVLKGSRIGGGSVIGAGSVVAGEIPPRVLAAGNPAQVLRRL